MFPIQSLAVECEVCLSHAGGGSKVTKPIFSNSRKRYWYSIENLWTVLLIQKISNSIHSLPP